MAGVGQRVGEWENSNRITIKNDDLKNKLKARQYKGSS